MRRSVASAVVGDLVKSFPKAAARSLGGEPPSIYSRHSGTTRESTAALMPASSHPALPLRKASATPWVGKGTQNADAQYDGVLHFGVLGAVSGVRALAATASPVSVALDPVLTWRRSGAPAGAVRCCP